MVVGVPDRVVLEISGIGPTLAEKYGEQILGIVRGET